MAVVPSPLKCTNARTRDQVTPPCTSFGRNFHWRIASIGAIKHTEIIAYITLWSHKEPDVYGASDVRVDGKLRISGGKALSNPVPHLLRRNILNLPRFVVLCEALAGSCTLLGISASCEFGVSKSKSEADDFILAIATPCFSPTRDVSGSSLFARAWLLVVVLLSSWAVVSGPTRSPHSARIISTLK
jgi:hypothetical protein